MNFTEATASMRRFFDANWPHDVPVAYDDVSFSKPDAEPWVRLTIKHNEGFQASVGDPGNNRHRREGIIVAQIFSPEGDASKTARELADSAADIFIGATDNGIHFYNTVAREAGNDGMGWYQINVTASFWYDRIA